MHDFLIFYIIVWQMIYACSTICWIFYHIIRVTKWYGLPNDRRPDSSLYIRKEEYVIDGKYVNSGALPPVKASYMIVLGMVFIVVLSAFWVLLPCASIWLLYKEEKKKNIEESI